MSKVTQGSEIERTVGQGVDATHTSNEILLQITNLGTLLPVPTARRGRIITKPAWRNRLDTYQVLEQQLARREDGAQVERRRQDNDILYNQC